MLNVISVTIPDTKLIIFITSVENRTTQNITKHAATMVPIVVRMFFPRV